MNDIIQKMFNKKNPMIASFGAKKLLGHKSGILYAKKDGIECKFDFYYIKNGLVLSVNAYYHYCSGDEHKKLTAIVSKTIDDMPSPRDYFSIAEYFGLDVDYNTYKQVVIEWMKCRNYQFYEKIKETEKPETVPEKFLSINNEIRCM